MAGHAYLTAVTDPATRAALKFLGDQINALQSQITTLQQNSVSTAAALDAKNQRVTNVADPTANTDAVNLQTLLRQISAQLESFKT